MVIYQRGKIYKFRKQSERPSKRKYTSCKERMTAERHAFVVAHPGEFDCQGFMLTTASRLPNNEELPSKYFVKGLDYDSHPKGSWFLTIPLQKVNDLDVYEVGMLTEDGMLFIESRAHEEMMTWPDYISRVCREGEETSHILPI